MNQHARAFGENAAEATTACVIAMVQGNLLVLSLSHWLIATQTGLVAGAATMAALMATRAKHPWVVSSLLGAITSVVDFFMHPGMIGPFFLEALLTGLGAALLSYVVQLALRKRRNRSGKAA